MLWFFAFVLNFTVAGMTGILLSSPPVDFQVHNSLFLIAHFHGMVIGGVLFGFFAGFTYWFPKFTGFFLDEKLNRYAFWCWLSGFLLAFMPLYMLGFMGATRRLDHYEASTGWHPLFVLVAIGAFIILCGACIQFFGLFWSIKHRKKNWDHTGGILGMAEHWNGRFLLLLLFIILQSSPQWIKSILYGPSNEAKHLHLKSNMKIFISLKILPWDFISGFSA